MAKRTNFTKSQRAALDALASAYGEADEFVYLSFDGICERAKEAGHDLPRTKVRRTVRHLARQGLATYGKGLWTEDGFPAGSGYAITAAGLVALPRETR